MTRPQLFLIGPGYIGGSILHLLVKEDKYDITTMVRRKEAAAALEKLGLKVLLATLDDNEIVSRQAAMSDIIIHTATADHKPSVASVLTGIEERAAAGMGTIFIHTSGTSLIGDKAAGDYASDKIFYDDKPEDIDALPDSAPHRLIDLEIVKARERLGKKAKLAIMIPPLIYGVSPDNRLSIQLPTLSRFAIKHGYAGHVGKGLSVWSQVHVLDLARAYVTLLHWLEGEDSTDIYSNPYFFCENGHELSWGECVAEIGRVLHQAGKTQSAEPKTLPKEDYGDVFGAEFTAAVVGSNSRSRANRLRTLGWWPREKETLASLSEDELPLILQEKDFVAYSAPVAS